MQRVFKAPFLVMMSLVVALLALAGGAAPASARTFVSVGIGVGPFYPAGYYGAYWHDPYWRWRGPYWAPYPVAYAPYPYYAPPAYVAPAPVVVQAPPPVVAQPVQAMAAKPAYDQANCREYTSTITVAGQPSQQVGTACQQPDGSWRIVN
ncbi:hypothetical protein UAJ10_29430 [Nitrospirillum sp. BR 11164]|uniref:hypothetical protein n=1 Tax=Nitrospirillum sp. BR 11164 TaxID=3104324 RepID=UPI002AFDE976|nr:hypothetical protein [Nitrospirillum sp. BR 11164]MEA1653126.1 hypothetical protein [Nitrospirillum sp. BR 11164]